MHWGKERSLAARIDLANGGKSPLRAAMFAALALLCSHFALPASAKTPGARYCFSGWCHRVSTLAQTETFVGWRGYLLASFYDDCHRDGLNPCGLTSSGAVFRPDLPDNAASPLFPDGTVILAYNPKSGDASILRITNAGPYSGDRKLDVSRAGAESLGFKDEGVSHLVVSVLKSPTIEEATYVRRRVYPSVPGHLGKFENFDLAYAAAMEKLDLENPPTSYVSPRVDSDAAPNRQLQEKLILRPRPAISPYFARELVMLRVPPRPVTRMRPMAGESEAASADTGEGPGASTGTGIDFGLGLRKFIGTARVMASGAQ
jgi:rare lipoprotein A